uniref:Uncharacterized protein n=2 Tax=Aegilops tauschii subsp. strangulata TaxID=200361 RepID=A0A453SZ72_AEGTS
TSFIYDPMIEKLALQFLFSSLKAEQPALGSQLALWPHFLLQFCMQIVASAASAKLQYKNRNNQNSRRNNPSQKNRKHRFNSSIQKMKKECDAVLPSGSADQPQTLRSSLQAILHVAPPSAPTVAWLVPGLELQ